MNHSDSVIELIVNQVVEILKHRATSVYKIDASRLSLGIDPSVYLRHGLVVVQQPPLELVTSLIQPVPGSSLTKAVSAIQEALSFGVAIQLNVHDSLLSALPISGLTGLPVRIADHFGNKVHLHHRPIISTHDLLTLECQWFVVEASTIVTPLAKEFMEGRNINLVKVR